MNSKPAALMPGVSFEDVSKVNGRDRAVDRLSLELWPWHRRHPKVPMRVESFAAATARWCRPDQFPEFRAGGSRLGWGSGSDARSLEAPIVQVTDG